MRPAPRDDRVASTSEPATEVGAAPALRARRLLERPGARLAPTPSGWVVRTGGEGRRRVLMRLTCAQFDDLAALRVLTPCRVSDGGASAGYRLARTASAPPAFPAVPPGQQARRPSALAWLATRRDASGRPWLDPQQLGAARRLEQDHERACLAPRLTARLDAGPGAPGRASSGDHLLLPAVEARARVRDALAATGPTGRTVLVHVCLEQRSLADTALRLGLSTPRTREQLQQALTRLARHYLP